MLGLQFNNAMLNDMNQLEQTNDLSQNEIAVPQKDVEEDWVDLADLRPKIELGQPNASLDQNNSTKTD